MKNWNKYPVSCYNGVYYAKTPQLNHVVSNNSSAVHVAGCRKEQIIVS